MRNSADRILTTQAGSLPRPDDLIALHRARGEGASVDEAAFRARLAAATGEVVAQQRKVGLDVPGDGEYRKSMGHSVDYGAWWTHSFQRLSGLELVDTSGSDSPGGGSPNPRSLTGVTGWLSPTRTPTRTRASPLARHPCIAENWDLINPAHR